MTTANWYCCRKLPSVWRHPLRLELTLAAAAIRSPQPGRRLKRCRELLRKLDPNRPPVTTQSSEFRWQYLALRERVHVYSEWLSTVDESAIESGNAIYKAENAVVRSLHYFCEALQERQPDDEDG
jgi:hypothetical protein